MKALSLDAYKLGKAIGNISFSILLKDHCLELKPEDFNLYIEREDHGITVFAGKWRDIRVDWIFEKVKQGIAVKLEARSENPLNFLSVNSLIFRYTGNGGNISNWRILRYSADYVNNPIGMPKVNEVVGQSIKCKVISGVFPDNKGQGVFLGTRFPQSSLHTYRIEQLEESGLNFTCTTEFVSSMQQNRELISETTWVYTGGTVKEAFTAFSDLLPPIFPAPKPAIGWNSWDYYFFTVSMESIIENMEEIRKDSVLFQAVKYIVIDEGWEHMNGEWQPNYKFPGGLERIVDEIEGRGFVPGIWTAPLLINPMSLPGWRKPELMVKNENGDPYLDPFSGCYLIDPTVPAAKDFLRGIYTKLYRIGFRLFKVDYVSSLVSAQRFFDRTKGPYDALRELFSLIRECVTGQSHILGCSLPAECGPGYADSGRTGIDIHNQWAHVEWAAECFTFKYWMNGRVWINDIDFLVTRGKDTSLETETNVLNANANNPNPPRWRRGPVFTKEESQTWTNIVLMSGGNVFLSDRISILNETGREYIQQGIQTTGVSAEPLDLCVGYHASFWLQTMKNEQRLTWINWEEEACQMDFNFHEYGLETPAALKDMWNGEPVAINNGRVSLTLQPHESRVLWWR